MNQLLRAALGHVPAEPPSQPPDDPKRLAWGKGDAGAGRNVDQPPPEPGMSSLIRAHADDIAARARSYERLADGKRLSWRSIGP